MRQNMGRKPGKSVGWMVMAVVLAIGFAVGSAHWYYCEEQADAQIRTTLEKCGASDAMYVEHVPGADLPEGAPSSKQYDLYRSEATGYDYYFQKHSGLLWKVHATDGLDGEGEAVSETVRQQKVLEAVSMYLGDKQIGVLEFESYYANNYGDNCDVVETHQGMQTGTRAYVRTLPDGKIVTCQLRYGSLFPDGLDDKNLLGEEKVCSKALKAMEKHLGGMTVQSTSCELKAVEDAQYYQVTLTVQREPYIIEFYAHLDAHTGALLLWYRTV